MYKGRPRDWNPINRTSGKAGQGIHMVKTECETLDEALDIIAAKNKHRAAAEGSAERRNRPPTLREQFRNAKARANMLKVHGKITLAGGMNSHDKGYRKNLKHLPPHPLKDLPQDQKRARVLEGFHSGHWGVGEPAMRRLAKAYDLPVSQIAGWLKGGAHA